ncbi:phytoene/squalene synthase family protein [Photobacterium angustum]|uniref:phytoene/squalene synthase family protein n=1 Tax=Photobacterium angustum TaxID=661 RepID=UPI0006975207|nr:phytoene/squalene synthase family protein [Photobacterium angustum]PSV88502.1 phytoene/squalene synthase family protein [Photobacterium angustum]PSW81865.1 phytoene/squalene synthase family protein [Photobacterium angustum]
MTDFSQSTIVSQLSVAFLQGGHKVTAKHGKTFYFASLFMGKRHAERSYCLYQFCRYLDDLADNQGNSSSKLNQFRQRLIENKTERDTVFLTESFELPINPILDLIDGFLFDQNEPAIDSKRELLTYCYRVAGTVGIMMCHALEVDDRAAFKYAIDLGIAMQLTNIARDVFEDAQLGRRYVPSTWLHGMAPLEIEQAPSHHCDIFHARKKLLSLAEQYYSSGMSGLSYLPKQSRLSIYIAAKCYQAIGFQIEREPDFTVRATVSMAKKCSLTAKCILHFILSNGTRRWHRPHDKGLHTNIVNVLGL